MVNEAQILRLSGDEDWDGDWDASAERVGYLVGSVFHGLGDGLGRPRELGYGVRLYEASRTELVEYLGAGRLMHVPLAEREEGKTWLKRAEDLPEGNYGLLVATD